jgi:hypothetical protein
MRVWVSKSDYRQGATPKCAIDVLARLVSTEQAERGSSFSCGASIFVARQALQLTLDPEPV